VNLWIKDWVPGSWCLVQGFCERSEAIFHGFS